MFVPLIIDEGPSLSTTASRAVAQLMLLWDMVSVRSASIPKGALCHLLNDFLQCATN